MKLRKFVGIIALVFCLVIVLESLPIWIWNSAALTQIPYARKVEADQLLQEGMEQHQTKKVQEALQSWQQALTIYREIQDSRGEANALGNLGIAYASLKEYKKAIDYRAISFSVDGEMGRGGEGES